MIVQFWKQVIHLFKGNDLQQRLISAEAHNRFICFCIPDVSILILPEKYCSRRNTARCFGLCDLGNIKSLLSVNAAEE